MLGDNFGSSINRLDFDFWLCGLSGLFETAISRLDIDNIHVIHEILIQGSTKTPWLSPLHDQSQEPGHTSIFWRWRRPVFTSIRAWTNIKDTNTVNGWRIQHVYLVLVYLPKKGSFLLTSCTLSRCCLMCFHRQSPGTKQQNVGNHQELRVFAYSWLTGVFRVCFSDGFSFKL